jgi:predicted MPP superfamily phosphohydrolase
LAGFVVLVLVVVAGVHLYLWKRLVRDALRPGWGRRVGAVIAIVLALLVPVTVGATRGGHLWWLAWPGYVWLGLMFYLLVVLVPLEVPRLALLLLWVRSTRTGKVEDVTGAAGATSRVGRDAGPTTDGLSGDSPDGRPAAQDPAAQDPAAQDPAAQRTVADRAHHQRTATYPTTDQRTAADNSDAGPGGATDVNEYSYSEHESDGDTRPAEGAHGVGAKAGDDGREVNDEEGRIARRLVLARGMAVFAGLTAAGITAYGMRTALGAPKLQRVQMPMPKLPRAMDGTRLAIVSDIHLGPLAGTHHVGRIVDLINSVTADIVCVVGDLVDGSVAELGRFAEPLAGIESRHGAFFVTGNHEYYSGFQPWIDEVARLGVRPLRNERVAIGGLDLAGVNDLGGAQYGDGPDFGRALGDRDRSRPVVLMAHQPVVAHDAAPFGVDLQVSGHTHGGQMAPFNLLVKLQQPVVSGFGRVDGVPVFVTNGAGFWGPPVRVGAPPQVTVMDLRSS